ncbi:MAG: hypothetical protein FD147_1373 [Chloroflexi bacterium]|nr:MAG: hypothetical protein FD147_1373 [Chloroflexota bacterium]
MGLFDFCVKGFLGCLFPQRDTGLPNFLHPVRNNELTEYNMVKSHMQVKQRLKPIDLPIFFTQDIP